MAVKPKPQIERPVLLARPRPELDARVVARELIARYPVILARLAE